MQVTCLQKLATFSTLTITPSFQGFTDTQPRAHPLGLIFAMEHTDPGARTDVGTVMQEVSEQPAAEKAIGSAPDQFSFRRLILREPNEHTMLFGDRSERLNFRDRRKHMAAREKS
jgi:hypothetical protein